MKCTDGNWEVCKLSPLSNWVVAVSPNDPMKRKVVANLYNNKDDANLISASPNMYDILKFIRAGKDDPQLYTAIDGQTWLDIDNVLDKAEGK